MVRNMLVTERLAARLAECHQSGQFRTLPRHTGSDFYSNDYLGLANDKELIRRISESEMKALPVGSTGSRLLSGNHPQMEALEERLARTFGTEAALLFNSGYALNIGLPGCLCRDGDVLLLDELAHASMKAGAKLARAKVFYFRHNDPEHLEARLGRLGRDPDRLVFILTESVFSMDGDMAPLGQMAELAKDYDASLIVDEAHGAGILGPEGMGLTADPDIRDGVFARIVTFGKAFGSHGAALLGSETLVQTAVNFCQSFIYTTAPSPGHARALSHCISYWQEHPELRRKLHENIAFMNRHLGLSDHKTPLYSFQIPCRLLDQAFQDLAGSGLIALPVRPPTVPVGTERLRVVLHAQNTKEEITTLCRRLRFYEAYWKKNICNGD